jgi:hypothetical protein
MNFHGGINSAPTTMAPSPNFQQYVNAPQMMNQYPQPASMAYHEPNSGAVRTPNRQSINLLTTTDQIDSWMWSLNAAGSGAGAGIQGDFTTGTVGHHVNGMMDMSAKGKKRRPEVGFSRG